MLGLNQGFMLSLQHELLEGYFYLHLLLVEQPVLDADLAKLF